MKKSDDKCYKNKDYLKFKNKSDKSKMVWYTSTVTNIIVFKSFFQIEYILIVLSLIFGFLLQTLKTKSLTSFNRLDQNLEIIQKHYVGTPATPATNEPINHLIVQEVQNDSIVFTLFDEKINRNLLKIITLCTDYDIYGS